MQPGEQVSLAGQGVGGEPAAGEPVAVGAGRRQGGQRRPQPVGEDGEECAFVGEAVASLRASREREGERLAALLRERLAAIGTLLGGMREQLVAAAPRYRERLRERLARLDVEANPERLEQELALIAQRTDVTEEADRLQGHLREIAHVLGLAEPVGRRLDFLIQELNREANTLASKVQDDELARRAVDLKVLIEQMREQVQNIE